MAEAQRASERITEEVTSWPGCHGGARAAGRVRVQASAGGRSAICTATPSPTSASRRWSGPSSSSRGGSTTTPSSPAAGLRRPQDRDR